MNNTVVFDSHLIRRYDRSGPRYTSYPTAVQFSENFNTADYRCQATASDSSGRPLSLYFHIPFCARVCFYCGCSKIVTANRKRALPYLQHLYQEIELQAELFDGERPIEQLHWGGGTPTFLNHDQMIELMRVTAKHFNLLDHDRGEYSIELDPRELRTDTIEVLRYLGFNRLSLGVQDFDPAVQQAVNRIQSFPLVEAAVNAARKQGFKSISFDLIYGLPCQSVESFDETLDQVIELAPDRLSVFNYAHLPALFKVQRQIDSGQLPSAEAKLEILQHVIQRLSAAGYVYIGMDHFARPDDELALAQQQGKLQRNFQGYSTHAGCDLIGLGLTAIAKVADCYSQNAKTLDMYYAALDKGELPIQRGIVLTSDDRLRREIISELICHGKLDFAAIEDYYRIRFQDYFAGELRRLAVMEGDGLLHLGVDGISISPSGRLLSRIICMVFDRYLQQQPEQRFSKVI